MKYLLALALITSVLGTIPSAQARADPDRRPWVYGSGTKSCGQWTAEKIETYRLNVHNTNVTWVTGFITAVSVTGGHPLNQTDTQAMTQWMDNYCAANPLNTVTQAAQALAQALAVH